MECDYCPREAMGEFGDKFLSEDHFLRKLVKREQLIEDAIAELRQGNGTTDWEEDKALKQALSIVRERIDTMQSH